MLSPIISIVKIFEQILSYTQYIDHTTRWFLENFHIDSYIPDNLVNWKPILLSEIQQEHITGCIVGLITEDMFKELICQLNVLVTH